MRPYPSKFQALRVESADVWAKAGELRGQAEQICASAESHRIRSALLCAQIEQGRTRRRHARLQGSIPT